MLLLWYLLVLNWLMMPAYGLTPNEIEAQRNGWNVNPKTQYHIQTDDGLERYFKFQTLNGQFRKEKRLEDGTVIGTEGWLDPSGYLRIKDYIADHNGFRIIRSKMIFVGKNQPIGDAIAITKHVPSQSGTFIKAVRPPNPFRQSTTLREVSNSNVKPRLQQTRLHGLRKPYSNYASLPYHGENIQEHTYGNSLIPSLKVKPPLDIDKHHIQQDYYRRYMAKYYNNHTIEHREHSPNNRDKIRRYDNLKKGSQYMAIPHQLALDHNLPEYDGTYTLADGFQYYLKTHYHEEEEKSDHRIGSFGYVDPFGIRRVIYYKADRNNGFLHKKNNRYVGSANTPYDPVALPSI